MPLKRQRASSIADVAQHAGVSRSTVSRALNDSGYVSEAVRVRVKEVAKRLRYSPHPIGKSLRTKKTKTIAVLIPDINNLFYSRIVEGVEEAARQKDYDVIITCSFYSTDEEKRQIMSLKSKLVDGFIFVHGYHNAGKLRELVNEGVPVVAVDRDPGTNRVPMISVDHAEAMKNAVSYLHGFGHQRIAYVAVSEKLHDPMADEKLRGYHQGLREMGLDFDQALLHAVIPTELNQIENARRAAPRLLQGRKPPTAIIAGSDYLAIGLIKGFAEAGIIVPDQVSIVGFDNVLFAEYVSPSLTTVKQPKKEKGVRATQILIDAIECPDAKPESRILLPTSIVERQSVGFPQRPASPGEVGSARINPIMS